MVPHEHRVPHNKILQLENTVVRQQGAQGVGTSIGSRKVKRPVQLLADEELTTEESKKHRKFTRENAEVLFAGAVDNFESTMDSTAT